MKINKPRGTQDYFADEYMARRELENKFVDFFSQTKKYIGLETPMFEQKSLFVRSVGDETDVVQKELFDLEQKSDEKYSLRPELTAGIVRFLIESGGLKSRPKPINVFSLGPCFRYERPQKGRKRQFNQLDVETIGKSSSKIDGEFIVDICQFLEKINIKNISLTINSFGSAETKKKYSDQVKKFLKVNSPDLCETCLKRVEKNPLRVLDCKNEKCKLIVDGAPEIELEEAESKYFEEVVEIVKGFFDKKKGSKIIIDPRLVRGLDYYTGVIFEISTLNDESRMSSIGGGGRYDKLIGDLGGPEMPAMGVGFGIERLVDYLLNQ